jgi:hypothetical protein
MNATDKRISEQGNTFDASLIRDFIVAALDHDAASDAVTDLLFEHVVAGRYHPSVVADSLRPIIDEILETATCEDWQGAADRLIEEARERNAEGG